MTTANHAIVALLVLAAASALRAWLSQSQGFLRNRLGGVYRSTRPLLFRGMVIFCWVVCATSIGFALWLAVRR